MIAKHGVLWTHVLILMSLFLFYREMVLPCTTELLHNFDQEERTLYQLHFCRLVIYLFKPSICAKPYKKMITTGIFWEGERLVIYYSNFQNGKKWLKWNNGLKVRNKKVYVNSFFGGSLIVLLYEFFMEWWVYNTVCIRLFNTLLASNFLNCS